VTPIRPAHLSAAPASNPAGEAARLAAQKAFFQMAMGRSAAPAPSAAAEQDPPKPIRTVELRPQPSAEAPGKILRPGSLLDIRV
jgi:hypothetical protein